METSLNIQENQKSEGSFEGWVILEVMGHRKLGGYLTEQTIAGKAFIRLDVTNTKGKQTATQFYSPESVYCITPTTEKIAVGYGTNNQPQPVQWWELPEGRPMEMLPACEFES